MLIHNPQTADTLISIIHNHHKINFTKQFSYPVYQERNNITHAWIGKNSNDELLIVVNAPTLTTINYLATGEHYYGKGLPSSSITLCKNTFKGQHRCISPKRVGHVVKPASQPNNLSISNVSNTVDGDILPPTSQNLPIPEQLPTLTTDRQLWQPQEITNLTLKILFTYSPNYLSTYIDVEELIADNNALCAISAAIFTNNNPTQYKVSVVNVRTTQVSNLENGKTCLFDEGEIEELLDDYVDYNYPEINALAVWWQANVVILQHKLCGDPEYYTFGTSYDIGFRDPIEACIAFSRPAGIFPQWFSLMEPTLLAHEIGHLLGCSHPLELGEIAEIDLLPGYGHKTFNINGSDRNGTVMSRADPSIWYFSNPNIFKYPAPDENIPCGVSGISEAYWVVNANLPRLAASVNTLT